MKLSALPGTVVLLTATLLELSTVNALTFDIVGRRRSPGSLAGRRRLGKRVDMNGSFGNGSTTVLDQQDVEYSCNITLGGSQFLVLIDTGSSDLWVSGNVPNTKNLSIASGVSYAEGEADGFINTATLVFDDYTVEDQAYILVEPSDSNPSGQGLIGLGPDSASNVRSAVGSSAGAGPLDRIFQQNTSTPNFISVLLSRVDETNPIPTGQLTVGSIVPGLEDIQKQGQLPALVDQFGVQHWETVMDANGIIGPDGQQIQTTTTIQNPTYGNSSQYHVVFDTGFTYPQVTRDVADAIYGRVPGAEFVTQSDTPGYWRVPCNYELNVTFLFNGVKYPISPLDLTTPEAGRSGSCMSTFQEIAPNVANHKEFGAFDMILGMAFLRNVYLMINFGDFVDGSSSNVASPYIQLLSTTDAGTAHTDFVNTRLSGVDTTGSQSALVPESQAQHSPEPSSSDDDDNDTGSLRNAVNTVEDKVKKVYKKWWFITAAAVIGAVLLGLIGWCLFAMCRTRRSSIRTEGAFVPAMGSYRPLSEPNMARPASPVWEVPGQGQGYGSGTYGYPAQGGQYHEPKYQYGGQYP